MENKYDAWLHYNIAFIGGFLGMYSILQRSDFLGAAQTSNMIYLVSNLLGHNYLEVLFRLGALILYGIAIALTVWIPMNCSINLKTLSIFIDFIAALVLGFLPVNMDPILGLYPIFFSMAFQWNSFKGARGFVSSSIFSTNNYRQFVIGLTSYGINKKKEGLDRAKFFGCTLVSFHISVAISYLLWNKYNVHSVWFSFMPIICAFVINYLDCGEGNFLRIHKEA